MDKPDPLRLASELLFKLTWNRIFLGLASVIVYTIYENRDKVFPIALSSPTLMGIMGTGLFFTLATAAIRALVLRTFTQYEERLAQQNHDCDSRLQVMETQLKDMVLTNQRLDREFLEFRAEYATAVRLSLQRIESKLGTN